MCNQKASYNSILFLALTVILLVSSIGCDTVKSTDYDFSAGTTSFYASWGTHINETIPVYDTSSEYQFNIVEFTGPDWYGDGLQIDQVNHSWSWDIGIDSAYISNFTIVIEVAERGIGGNYFAKIVDTAFFTIQTLGYAIHIDKIKNQLQGHMAEVSINLDSKLLPTEMSYNLIGGFDFLIAYDASVLTATQALPGALIDNDKFEYFTYRFGANGNCGGSCPSGLIRIVAMRETNDGITNDCHITSPGELAKIDFLVTSDYNLECQHTAIRFFWLDCGDNTLSDESGYWLNLGLEVIDFENNPVTDPIEYGYTGPAADCYDTVFKNDEVVKNSPIGSIAFYNGGIEIICKDTILDRGDVNYNGIPYEIADAVVFTNYFIEGFTAFMIDVEGQTEATEINGDGIPLTVADFLYLVRVIVGDASPMPQPTPNAYACFSKVDTDLLVESNVDLGAALFVINGNIYPTLANDAVNMELKYGHDGGKTRALVWSADGSSFSNGAILNINGGTLDSVGVAEYNGTTVECTSPQ